MLSHPTQKEDRQTLNFASDNVTGASDEILNAIMRANAGYAMPYGNDDLTAKVERQLSELFETDLRAFLVATGSAANSLALSVMTPSYGAVLCHWTSHVFEDECGAPEFFTGGARMVPVDGPDGKIDLHELAAKAARGAGDVHMLQPSAASITQVTELGSLYTVKEITAVAEVCRSHKLNLHMDGARFANAVVALGCTPAEMSWKAGVDVLSFGATKNGALGAEAVIFFDTDLADTFAFRRKRGGHLFSKMRLLSAQMEAYLSGELWRSNAEHANAMAARLREGIAPLTSFDFPYTDGANMLFPKLPATLHKTLHDAGFIFYGGRWEKGVARLVTAFNTDVKHVDAFIEAAIRWERGVAESRNGKYVR